MQTDAPTTNEWVSAACSGDGTVMAAVDNAGGIWIAQAAGSVQAPPHLYLNRAGDSVTLYWQNVSGWSLYQTANLNLPVATGWVPSAAPTLLNGTNYLTVTPATGNAFFQLQQ